MMGSPVFLEPGSVTISPLVEDNTTRCLECGSSDVLDISMFDDGLLKTYHCRHCRCDFPVLNEDFNLFDFLAATEALANTCCRPQPNDKTNWRREGF